MAETPSLATARADRRRHSPDLVLVGGGDAGSPERENGPAVPIRVVIADGQTLVRAGFRALLDGEDDVTVVGEAADGEDALALAAEIRPDVLLLDAGLPGLDGVAVTRRIAADPQLAAIKVVVVGPSENDESVFGALRAGAGAFLVRDAPAQDLVGAVRTVAAGGALLSPSITLRLIAEFTSQPAPERPRPEQLEELTPRELEVVALAAKGLSNGQIAERLVVSPATAKTHVSRAMCKLQARDRARLVALAYECGLVVARPNPGPAPRDRALAAA